LPYFNYILKREDIQIAHQNRN